MLKVLILPCGFTNVYTLMTYLFRPVLDCILNLNVTPAFDKSADEPSLIAADEGSSFRFIQARLRCSETAASSRLFWNPNMLLIIHFTRKKKKNDCWVFGMCQSFSVVDWSAWWEF